MHPARALTHVLAGREDAGRLALVRIVVGCAALARTYDAARILERLDAPTTLRLPYVPWVPQLAGGGLRAVLVAWVVAALLFTLGWHTRAAGAALASCLAYVVLLDEQTYSNHLYLLSLVVLLLALANAGAARSLDARRRPDARRAPRDTVAAWPVFLLKCQVSVVYAFSALSKINREFLSGATLDGLWLREPLAALSPPVAHAALLAASWGCVAIELFLAVALWLPGWRTRAVIVGVATHAAMVLTLTSDVRLQLAVFAIEMFALYVLFLPATSAAPLVERRRPATPAGMPVTGV